MLKPKANDTHVGQDVEQLEFEYTVGESIKKQCNYFGSCLVISYKIKHTFTV